MNILKKLFQNDKFVAPWIAHKSVKLSPYQLNKLNKIALPSNLRIYDKKYIFRASNFKYSIAIDLDDTLVLPDTVEEKIYLRKYLYLALKEIKKIKGVQLVLWTASSRYDALDKFERFPKLIDLFDQIIFGENFSNQEIIFPKKAQIKEEKEFIELAQNYNKKPKDLLFADVLLKSIDFRKKFEKGKNLHLLNFDLLIDNSRSENEPSKWMDFSFIQIPTYDLNIKTEKNEIDFVTLEIFLSKLPELIKNIINSSHSSDAVFIKKYQENLNTLFVNCLNDERQKYLLTINDIILSENLEPLPIHKAILQNTEYITFSAICRIPQENKSKIFFKARAKTNFFQKSQSKLDFRSFYKEMKFLEEFKDIIPFIPKFIKKSKKNNIDYYYYNYIPSSRMGDTWLINPTQQPNPKITSNIVDKIRYIQNLKVSKKINNEIKIFDFKEADSFWTNQHKFLHKSIFEFIDEKKLIFSKTLIDRVISTLKEKDLVLAHGDFHPANILIDEKEVFIIDWEMLQKNNSAYDLTMLWLRSWNYPKWRDELLQKFQLKSKDNFLDLFNANILLLAPAEIAYWAKVINEPWRHHYKIARRAIESHKKAFNQALFFFEE